MRTMPRRLIPFFILMLVAMLSHGCASGPPPSPTERGEIALAEGDWRSAKREFAEALRLDSRNGRAWLGQARAQGMARDPESALRSLSSLAEVDRALFRGEAQPHYADALEAATRSRLDRKQSESALVAVRALVKMEPGRRGVGALLGRSLIAEASRWKWLGKPDPALAHYLEACRVVPGSLEGWVGAAEILIEQGRGKEAVKLLATARKRHPTAGSIRTLSIQALGVR